MAGSILKGCIKDVWNNENIKEEDRELIRKNIPKGLIEKSTKLILNVVSKNIIYI